MGEFGDDFDPAQPSGTSPVAKGDDAIRDLKQRVKNWVGRFWNNGGETFRENAIPVAALPDSGVAAGEYNLLSVDGKGRVTAAKKVTGLAELGVTAGEQAMVPVSKGGTGLDAANAGPGTLLIGNGSGFSLAALIGGDGVKITSGSGTLTIELIATPLQPFFQTTVLTSAKASEAVTLVTPATVGDARKVVVTGFLLKVIGSVAWSENTVHLGTSNSAPIVSAPSGGLTANALLFPHDGVLNLSSRFTQGSGGEYGNGLFLRAEQNGTGSDLAVSVWGYLVT